MERKKTEKTPNSFFKKLQINSLNDIFELYLHYEIDDNIVNSIFKECAFFLNKDKNVSFDFLEKNFGIFFEASEDRTLIFVKGKNLISSLWIIGVYPKNPESLIDQTIYEDGDFKYEFYTENQNFIVNKINAYDRNNAVDPRNSKISKRSQ